MNIPGIRLVVPLLCGLLFAAPIDAKEERVKAKSDNAEDFRVRLAIECISCRPPTTSTQIAKANGKGGLDVQLSKPGSYRIRYADGPQKGQIITTINARSGHSWYFIAWHRVIAVTPTPTPKAK